MKWKRIYSPDKDMCDNQRLGTTRVSLVNIYGVFYLIFILLSPALGALILENLIPIFKRKFYQHKW